MAKKAKNLLKFEPVEGMTYCSHTKHVATVAGLPYPLFFLIVVELLFIAPIWGMGWFFAVALAEIVVWKRLKKIGIPFNKLMFYLSERRSNFRRSLPRRKQKLWVAANRTMKTSK